MLSVTDDGQSSATGSFWREEAEARLKVRALKGEIHGARCLYPICRWSHSTQVFNHVSFTNLWSLPWIRSSKSTTFPLQAYELCCGSVHRRQPRSLYKSMNVHCRQPRHQCSTHSLSLIHQSQSRRPPFAYYSLLRRLGVHGIIIINLINSVTFN